MVDKDDDQFEPNPDSYSRSGLESWISQKIDAALKDHKTKIYNLQQEIDQYQKALEEVNVDLKKTQMNVKTLEDEVQSLKKVMKKFVEDEGGNTPVKTRGGRTAVRNYSAYLPQKSK